MESPPVQYVRTPDGFDIAYTVCGDGLPLVMMPWPFSHMGLMWQLRSTRPLLDALSERFRLIQYDSRGQGMSTRGLPEYHSIEDYETDLEAVVDRVGLDRFVLYGGPLFGHAAVRYALKHAERVCGLILGDVMLHTAWGAEAIESLARQSWDMFLHTFATSASIYGAPVDFAYWREAVDQADCLRMMKAAARSKIESVLPELTPPTLIMAANRLAPEEAPSAFAEAARRLAASIPDSRLILHDNFGSEFYSEGPEPPIGVLEIEAWLTELGLFPPVNEGLGQTHAAAQLSPREREVLRLIAEGRSNQQIADELVISLNTVRRHVSNIFDKAGVANRAQAVAYAKDRGIA